MLKLAVIEEKKFKHSRRVGADNPWGPKCLCQQEGLITMVICCKFKNLQHLTLYKSFHESINVYSRKSEADNPRAQNFYVNRNLLSLRSFATSLKKKLFAVWFYSFFMILYKYIAPGQGLTTPWGRNFDVNRNILTLRSFVASFKKSLWSLILYNFFMIYTCTVYSPRAGPDSPHGTKFWCQQKCLVTSFICCKFKKKCLWSLILYKFFHDLIHVYSPGALQTDPRG